MPRFWYDYHANSLPDGASEEEIEEREFNLRILADRKPYFMRYIYPSLMKEYKTYVKSASMKCMCQFRMALSDLLAMPEELRTDEQNQFVAYYEKRLPVSDGNCVMNRICRKFEAAFDGKMKSWCEEPFDYTIMKSDAQYTDSQFRQIKKIYDEHNKWLQSISVRSKAEKKRPLREMDDYTIQQEWFKKKCWSVCNNLYALENAILDLCYQKSGTKEFVWDISSHYVIANLARNHGYKLLYPTRDPDGDIEYAGMRFSMRETDWRWTDSEEELLERNHTEREGMGEEGD